MKLIFTIILLVPIIIAGTAGAENITFNDLYSFAQAGDLQFSPDGKNIIFTKTEYDVEEGSSTTHIWSMDTDGTNLRQLTNGPTDEWHPRWSPDGRFLLFISDREDGSQAWVLPADGGEARQVTDISTGVRGAEWFPNSDKILFYSRVYPDCSTDSCNQARESESESNPIEAKVYDELLFRHYNSWDDGRVNQLFTTTLDGEISRITQGPYDAPTSLLGGYVDYDISPDGNEICYVMNTDSMPALSTNNDLFLMDAAGGEYSRIIIGDGQQNSPFYSPDGRYIACLSQARAGYESDQNDLLIYDRNTRRITNLTDNFDLSVAFNLWGPESKYIYFQAIEHGFSPIWRINIETRKMEKLLSGAVFRNLNISPDGRFLVVNRSLSDQPYEMYLYDIAKNKSDRLTYFTGEFTDRVRMNRAEEFWFTGFNGDSVHGFLTLPPDFNNNNKYPLALLIHGGPQWCWLGDFNYYGWNTQLVAAQGYIVAQIDPHGSVGYGLAFKEYVSGNWGKGDYEDLMLGVDYLIDQHPYIDTTRMAALGRSYGGFMTNWICGRTDRFKCLITVDGLFSQFSSYYTTEELWFPEWEFKGTPYTNPEEYRRSSPETYVQNFNTPTLIVHGQKDYRVDVSEAFQMFTALRRLGIPAELVYFPDESHSIRKIKNHRFVYEKQFEWLEKWLK